MAQKPRGSKIGRPRCTVEDEVVGAERAALLTDIQRRGLRNAVRLWRGDRVDSKTMPIRDLGQVARWAGDVVVADADGGLRRFRWPLVGTHEHTHRCPTRYKTSGVRCAVIAGKGTDHVGFGRCAKHGGNRFRERTEGAWLVAHAFAQELDITPWEALLKAVRIAAGKVAYIEWVLGSAKSDLELEGRVIRSGEGDEALLVHPDTGDPLGVGEFRDLSWWVKQSELWHDRMARTAKLAVDAGVAKWQIEKAEAEANAIARVLNAVVEELEGDLPEKQIARMRSVMRKQLLALDEETTRRALASTSDADVGVVDSTYREE